MQSWISVLFGIAMVGAGWSPGVASAAPQEVSLDLNFAFKADLLQLPRDLYLGEVAGVATTSQRHILVFTRTGSQTVTVGASRAFVHGGSRLFEFDAEGKYVREIGAGIYGFMSAHAVRVDSQDNIWAVDEASEMVIEFSPKGNVVMTLGRKPEAVPVPARTVERGEGMGVPGDSFGGPTDVAWNKAGDIFVADGSGNSRIVKFDRHGSFVKAWGGHGGGQGQFNNAHSLAMDASDNLYVADTGNGRIQVFDSDGNFKTQIIGMGAPTAICISSDSHPYLYSSHSNSPIDLDNGEIYKMELDGRIVGRFGHAGRRPGDFNSVHEIDCRGTDTLLVAELGSWRVQKLTLRGR